MAGLIIDGLDASFDSIEWTEKSYSLSSFVDQYGSTLPHIVNVVEGFCGVASSCTIDSGQILILHSMHNETKILAKDAKDYDLFIPKNFQVKVEMVPKNSFEEYSTIQDLLRTFPNCFRVLDDIPSLDVTSGSIFQISRQNTSINCIECPQVGSEDNKRTKFPLNLKGRFQPLQDSREFFLDEVLYEDNSLVTVHFVKSGVCGNNQLALDELGNIRLMGECKTESVFATVINSNEKSLAVFPKTLNITIQPAVLGSENYCKLRKDVITNQDKTVRRIQRLNKLVVYQARNPIRQFPALEILPPVLPKPRTQSLLDSCAETSQDHQVKERSNSTPLLPTQPPKRSQTFKTIFKTAHKKPLKETSSVPIPIPIPSNKTKHPIYKPPPISSHPSKQLPPLPPKDKSKPIVSQASTSETSESPLQNISLDGQLGPTKDTPTPPPRLRRKKKKNEVTEEIVDDEGYVKMNPDEMVNVLGQNDRIAALTAGDLDKRVGCAYEQMDFPFLVEQCPEQSNSSCLNNEQTVSDTYEQMEPPYLIDRSSGAYEEMNLPYLNLSSTKSDDDSSKTLDELFGVVHTKMDSDSEKSNLLQNLDCNHNSLITDTSGTYDDHDYYNMKKLALPQDNKGVSVDFEVANELGFPKNINPTDESENHDYCNMKNLDLNNEESTDHDYENTKSIEKARESGDENTKEFDASSLPRSILSETKSLSYKDSEVVIEASELRSKRQAFAYENTGLSNREVPFPNVNVTQTNLDDNISGNDGKLSSSLKNALDIESLQISTSDDELALLSQSSPSCFRYNMNLTMTEQLVNHISLRRPSPIGMEEGMINDEDEYANMNENNTCANEFGEHNNGEYYEPMQITKSMDENNTCADKFGTHSDVEYCEPMQSKKAVDQSFQRHHGKDYYVPMNESLRRPDSGIYENEPSDQESEGRNSSFYEEIDFPLNPKKGKRQASNFNLPHDPNEADGSSANSDSEDFHNHQVELPPFAMSLEDQDSDEDIYEDVDMPKKLKQVANRPKPPSRRPRFGKSSNSEGDNSDCGMFHTPLTTTQETLTGSAITSSPRDVAKSAPTSKTVMTPPTFPPGTLEKDQTSESSNFVYIDDMQLHIAIRESMENIKKSNKSRPPAPPPKKLNYVKLEPLPGPKPGTPPKKPQQTNYSDVVGTEKPPKQNKFKEDEMEYIDDCKLHFSEIEKLKKQKERKDKLKKQIEKNLSDKAGKITKYGSFSSNDLKESPYINKIRDVSRDQLTEKETVDSSKPTTTKRHDTKRLVQVFPLDVNQLTLEKNSRDANKSIKPAVPKKPKPKSETLKEKPTLPTTNIQNNANSPVTNDSVKKRALIPPPKPKRIFLDDNNEGDSKTDEETANLSPNSGYVNTQEISKTTVQTPFQHQTEVPRKKPLPLPRKKLAQGPNSKTTQDSGL